MLNQSVASTEFFSSLAEKILCATYPPPPGSAPGYQDAHQFTAIYTKNVRKGIHVECRSGRNDKTEPVECLFCSTRTSDDLSEESPPDASTAKTASRITIPIFRTNWKRSVHNTPQSPESVEIDAVITIRPSAMPSASIFETPRTSIMILTIARLTHPMMIRLIGRPR